MEYRPYKPIRQPDDPKSDVYESEEIEKHNT